jgi:hypothetical protein
MHGCMHVLDLHIKHHNWKGKNREGENGIGSWDELHWNLVWWKDHPWHGSIGGENFNLQLYGSSSGIVKDSTQHQNVK